MTEFDLIARYFDRPVHRARLGIGDDCALLAPSAGRVLAISSDMLVAGRHFFEDAEPWSIGWKTLAVNLSDLAAMGAKPLAFTLALALPAVDEAWLAAFSSGLFACATRFDCELIGGDTTRGPLNLCVTIFGEVAEAEALRRDGAKPEDDVWVSGSLGRAALALQRSIERRDDPAVVVAPALQEALDRPQPRVALGMALAGIAHAAIDLSDGFAQDLGHIVAASRGAGATVFIDDVPFAEELMTLPRDQRHRLALAGGDDYELCFTAPTCARDAIVAAARAADVRVTRVGVIDRSGRVAFVEGAARGASPDSSHAASHTAIDAASLRGFDHFA
jgi:thiamine-monophosphate kinase